MTVTYMHSVAQSDISINPKTALWQFENDHFGASGGGNNQSLSNGHHNRISPGETV